MLCWVPWYIIEQHPGLPLWVYILREKWTSKPETKYLARMLIRVAPGAMLWQGYPVILWEQRRVSGLTSKLRTEGDQELTRQNGEGYLWPSACSLFTPGKALSWQTEDCGCFNVCECLVAQLCLTLCNPLDCSLPGSSIHGIFQARVLEWVVISSSRGSSQTRDWNLCLLQCRQILYPLRHQTPFKILKCNMLTEKKVYKRDGQHNELL